MGCPIFSQYYIYTLHILPTIIQYCEIPPPPLSCFAPKDFLVFLKWSRGTVLQIS